MGDEYPANVSGVGPHDVGRAMDIAVQQARTSWREALDRVDEVVDRFMARGPVEVVEWVTRDEHEHAARRAYYALLRTRYGLPKPLGLGDWGSPVPASASNGSPRGQDRGRNPNDWSVASPADEVT